MAYTVSHRWGNRDLPHIETPGATYYITFNTKKRKRLSARDRDIVMKTFLRGHLVSFALYVLIVMPDHVHFIATPYEQTTLPAMMKFLKRVSAGEIGRRVWQEGYFDRIVRKDEDLRRFAEYVVNNALADGLVEDVEHYRWMWRSWIDGERG